mmetsp:Transcript_4542/g.4666  ORF Transcript_4542/g.4666 Transcript_4542/m.4666 type:complete len:179 (+) Transcript_4542:99-635(+)|eukprot:CAMPEP_0182420578 /NCGR_PEP_ID=MMETSP1167-20130531/5495_1 /TAXON_ID=2988 /ORGANISM="Mallomonas Sp, Strain CCMP3275" /LENGTH=178 /DNA_ID=CAMNT_0024596733 /DNA_START=69 /DNA_END=605 /DNA_ORIENTATION=-
MSSEQLEALADVAAAAASVGQHPVTTKRKEQALGNPEQINIQSVPMTSLSRAKSLSSGSTHTLSSPLGPRNTAVAPPVYRDRGLDWHLHLTVEERQLIRSKIRNAYKNKIKTYDQLLDTCTAIEEEMLYMFAPSRLDYFKNGMQFEKRVGEKKRQLSGTIIDSIPEKPPLKRSKSTEN